ncbi:MAG TPA: flagellar basal body-associated FliL family protein [Verrucomicrobiae bacterium]|nr:flagellar basal body-associated FliL family protein [Verrucomicrobiae bacterium]
MAANRIEPGAEAASAAPEAVKPSAGGGMKAWLPLIITIVLMPALAWGMTTFVLLPRLQSGLGITPEAAAAHDGDPKKAAANAKKESVTVNKLLVNVAGTMGQRYLLVSLSVVGADPAFRAKMQESDPQLRDMACGTLATKTLADLEKPGARNLVRSELISGFNTILGAPMVQEIYLTEFAIQ